MEVPQYTLRCQENAHSVLPGLPDKFRESLIVRTLVVLVN